MNRFKPGDLVILVGGIYPEFIGRVFELVEFLLPWQETIVAGDIVQNDSDQSVWMVAGDFHVDENEVPGFAAALEEHLIPLRRDFEPETESELIEVTA